MTNIQSIWITLSKARRDTMNAPRKVIDCRLFPSEKNCSLAISGTEEEIMEIAVFHAVSAHGHKDTPELREQLRAALKDEVVMK